MSEADFNAGTSVVKVDYWTCSREEHQNNVFHYHCALKLTGCKKWLSVKKRIARKNCIQVKFSFKHNLYLSKYKYICKSDQQVTHRENYRPGFLTVASSKTKKSIEGFRAVCATKAKSTEGESSCFVAKKQKSVTNLDLAEFIQERRIRSYTKLLAIAEEQRTADQMDIAEFAFKRNEKILRELVTKSWQMEPVKESLKASKASRIDTVKTHWTSDCVESCSGQSLQRAKEVFLLNGIDTFQFILKIY